MLTAMCTLGGCKAAQVTAPLTDNLAGNEPATQMEFWHTLVQRPVVSNDEAWHGLLLFVDGQDTAETYDARVEALKSRSMLPAKFDRPANEAVLRGNLAVALCAILEIKGGVIMHVLGPSPRYATRELQYRGIYLTSSPHQTFSGQQFLAVLSQVEAVQEARAGGELTAIELQPAGEP